MIPVKHLLHVEADAGCVFVAWDTVHYLLLEKEELIQDGTVWAEAALKFVQNVVIIKVAM